MISSAPGARASRLRLRLFTSVALLAGVTATAAHAQTPPAPSSEPLNLEANTVDATKSGVVTASGDVVARYQDRTLSTNRLRLDQEQRIIQAEGDVRIVDDKGNAEFARSITLDQDLNSGVAVGFSAREGVAKFAAATAIHHSETLNELNKAIFTPCEICTADGTPKNPTWSVSADKIVQDRESKLVYYRNATIRVKGVPILVLPVFWHADPQADRLNGLLPPRIMQNRRRGLSYEQGYLWNISPSQDLVIAPQLNTRVAPFLNLEWRRRFYSGEIDARFGYTYERDFNTAGVKFGDRRAKAYVLGSGRFEPSEDWTFGFSVARAQDKLVFDQYSTRDVYQNTLWRQQPQLQGLFLSDDRRLITQAYAVEQNQHSYLSISMLSFQSLRPLLNLSPNAFGIRPFEDDDSLPTVAPLIEGRFEPEGPVLGGRLRMRGSGVVLTRSESPVAAGAPGIDSARFSAEIDWRRYFTLGNGLRVEPFADGRSDFYRVHDLPTGDATTQRTLGTLGLDVSLPMIRQFGDTSVIVEPIVQFAVSQQSKIYPNIPNEDSIAFDFDDTNLFEPNKSPGFDIYEGGRRANVGLRTTVQWGEGRSAEVLVGRSYRNRPDPNFASRTGLRERSSDWIFAAEANPIEGLSFYTKARLDDRNLEANRVEVGADVTLARADGFLRYLREDQDFAGVPREDIEAAGEVFITRNWGFTFDAIHDLAQSTWRRRAAGVVYRDDCTRFEVLYQRQDNPVLGGRSSDAIALRLTLAINGDAGYSRRDRRR